MASAIAAMGAMAAGTVVSAFGQYYSGQAAAQAAQYNSAMAAQNAAIQKQNAVIAGQAGAQQATMQGLKTRAQVGATMANQGASSITVNSGSAAKTVTSERELGLLDAIQVRNNATKQAYGYEVQSVNDMAQSKLDRFKASTDKTMSYLNAGGTLLSGAGSTYNAYNSWKNAGGLGGGSGGGGAGNPGDGTNEEWPD